MFSKGRLAKYGVQNDPLLGTNSPTKLVTERAAKSLMPSGTVIASFATTTPVGFLYCDGTAVSRTTYSGLFSAIGTSCGSGDGSTTFNLPDLRGQFLRGQNDSSGTDPDASGRGAMASGGNTGDNVGSTQSDQNASHNHRMFANASSSTDGASGNVARTGNAGSSAERYRLAGGATASPTRGDTSTSGGNESRPTNVNVRYYIKI